MKNFIGIIVGFVYNYTVLYIPRYFTALSLEGKRKLAHILLGGWWIIAVLFFDNLWAAASVPLAYTIIHYISLKRNKEGGLLSSLERHGEQKSYGVVLYPFAMFVLVLISFLIFEDIRVGGIGMFALSFGDGFAAITGKKFNFIPFRVFGNKKTVSGCIAMFFASFCSITLYMYLSKINTDLATCISYSSIISIVATIIESCTPYGIDNLTIPLSAIFTFLFISK